MFNYGSSFWPITYFFFHAVYMNTIFAPNIYSIILHSTE